MSASAAVFGKLPAHGDFVARGMDPAVRAAWDRFASGGLERVEQELGEGFAAVHEAAAPWSFLTAPGRGLSQGWGAGVLVPSVDRVGRRFVLAVLAEGLVPSDAERHGAPLAERLGDVALTAFTEGRDADALLAEATVAVAAFGLEGLDWPAEGLEEAWWPAGEAAAQAPLRGPGAAERAIAEMFAPQGGGGRA